MFINWKHITKLISSIYIIIYFIFYFFLWLYFFNSLYLVHSLYCFFWRFFWMCITFLKLILKSFFIGWGIAFTSLLIDNFGWRPCSVIFNVFHLFLLCMLLLKKILFLSFFHFKNIHLPLFFLIAISYSWLICWSKILWKIIRDFVLVLIMIFL